MPVDPLLKAKSGLKSLCRDKTSSGSGVDAEANYQLGNEFHRQIIKKFKRRKFIHLLETIFGVFI